ncbi:MAG: D-aminoacyl-tRNA deacylase [Deltaproteobacteria bacterium]|nr:D-aminoacyl-tRNA deacylase [Deltaproteobacteria bacterium]
MRAVIQRVAEARVTVGNDVVGKIGPGLCILLGVSKTDGENNVDSLARKASQLRIFEDYQGKLNRSVIDTGGEVLVVSQFTLYGDCRKGNRPSFSEAAPPAEAERLYEHFVAKLRAAGLSVATGRFQAAMKLALENDGPVTLILES